MSQVLRLSYLLLKVVINQATNINDILKIIIITDSIHVARKIFDLLSYLFQKHLAIILNELWVFFSCHQENSIEFWEYFSQCNWHPHKIVDAKTKLFNHTLLLLGKLSWYYNKKNECNDLINRWKMTFQVSDMKGRHFFNLVDSNNNVLEPAYSKGGIWLKYFGHSNILCTRALRVITNHALISKYRLRFFPREEFSYLQGQYPIESR